ncbi:uncharacterized protein Z519_06003 [Cladophialophora bantiana CBS 173.52]|uniref:Uncharacterized protein n=1 Tax=Cladophialophora bantiana (strain ATCC 10958 / CBS 173.52 / CDC B-1940 / NIH 8579) TaxID=1442370 RepID=A0A0D2HJB6_CLAB1|nr:uncharacterized protein Z519_06003 [Cladophialophora bantiana CBS 173.52]KIW93398.1 hypothetical protein Z519_06003 [Cladophialophora bantiana CBS 173.52]
MATELNLKIFERSFAYFSRDLENVQRDWEKVTTYGKSLGVLDISLQLNYTNQFLEWTLDAESNDLLDDQRTTALLQNDAALSGGFHCLRGLETKVET